MTKQTQSDGWQSENGLSWFNPAPHAAAAGGCTYVIHTSHTDSFKERLPVVVPNPVEKLLEEIQEQFHLMEEENGELKDEIEQLKSAIATKEEELYTYKTRCKEVEDTIEKIRSHL